MSKNWVTNPNEPQAGLPNPALFEALQAARMGTHSSPRVTWIVGASSGIGRALAEELVQRGDSVVISARSMAPLLEQAIIQPQRIMPIAVDVTDQASLAQALTQILMHWGRIDRVILNAADYAPMGLAEFDPALFERLMQVNFMGIIYGIEAVRAYFLARGAGQIIITASVAGYRGLPYAAPYGATKAALINMAESLAPEFAAHGVRLRVISPGFVRTPMTAKNTFTMPGIIEPAQAAYRIARQLEGSQFELLVPRGFGWLMKLIRVLPYPIFFALTRRMLKK
jgi:NAD(P)-dependent dehydrogenase (short-subunit alcohol dehydrogenase family)